MLTLQALRERYPAAEHPAWREEIAALLREQRIRLVVIDDDPTGIQTVHGCLLLTEFGEAQVEQALTDEAPFFYMLVNSRALTEEAARAVVREAMEAVLKANRRHHYNLVFVSRSDSTLRGHFPAEPDTMVEVLAEHGIVPELPMLFIPSFFEAGRLTAEGVHYMVQGEELVPVAETEFARDNVFGYKNSHLGDYIVEKGGGTITRDEVCHITLDELRRLSPEALGAQLRELGRKRCISFDSIHYDDLQRLALAILGQVVHPEGGRAVVIRSSSSLPKAMSGIAEQGYLAAPATGARGVVVVGSHVKKSTEQLMHLLESERVRGVEIDVEAILNDSPTLMTDILGLAAQHYAEGYTPVLYTSRREVRVDDVAQRQALGMKISRFLVEAVRALPFRPDFLISKGGITSHDILTHSLEVRVARVAGQAAAGIPTIQLGSEEHFANLRYVIFPGNVGAVETLREVVERMSR
ncbi:MAG: hypothetical protein IKZ12_04795 [Alistipes sp.]|nr:hypothetical protein [Alistipes sp.]